MFLPNFYSISIENAPVAPTYEYKRIFTGTLFTKGTCSMVKIVKGEGTMQVSAHNSTKCEALLPSVYTVTL
jgi:hypothetical protein